MTELQRLATALHDLMCHFNHIDVCGWGYESWEKGRLLTRGRWLERAEKFVHLCDEQGITPDQALAILKIAHKV